MSGVVHLNIKQKLKWVGSHRVYSLLFLIVLLVAGFFVYQKVATELDRRAFANARIAIDEVYAVIVKEVGEPDNSKFVSECSEGYSGAYNPVTACSVGTEFIYGIASRDDYLNKVGEIRTVILKHKTFKPIERPLSNIDVNPAVSTEINSELDSYSISGLLCSVKYTFDIPHETFLSLKSSDGKKLFYITMGCSSKTRTAYYPSKY